LTEKFQWHITMKELVAVRQGILRFANDLSGHTVCLYEDNQQSWRSLRTARPLPHC